MISKPEIEAKVAESLGLVLEVMAVESIRFTKEREEKLMKAWKILDSLLVSLQALKNY